MKTELYWVTVTKSGQAQMLEKTSSGPSVIHRPDLSGSQDELQ